MEIIINDGLLPSNGLKQIRKYYRLCSNHFIYNIGKYNDLRRQFKGLPYEEITNLDSVGLDNIDPRSTLIIVDPDEELMIDARLHELMCGQTDKVGSIILVMKRATLRESPYNDLAIPFFYRLRQDYILQDTFEIKIRGTRYDNEYAYDHKIYQLQKNVTAEDHKNKYKNTKFTNLKLRLNNRDDFIYINHPEEFPSTSYIEIGNEILQYKSNDDKRLGDLVRGLKGTQTPAVHTPGTTVRLYSPSANVRRMPVLLSERR